MALTLSDVIPVLEPGPLDENHQGWYVDNTTQAPSGRDLRPLANLRAKLLRSRDDERLFLSGHIGSGKSTELRRLLREPEVLQKYFVVDFAVRGSEVATLTSHQLLFIVAAEIHRHASEAKLLEKGGKRWEQILKRLNTKLFGKSGITAKGETEVEVDLFFVKFREQLSLEEARRVEFRRFAETESTVLVDLINALVEDVSSSLLERGEPYKILVVIDDTDKVRKSDQIDEIFDANLSAILAPAVPIVMTTPASVTFGGPTTGLGANITHLRPIQVLRKTSVRDPMRAVDPGKLPLMRRILDVRGASAVFDGEVVEAAAVYSGGVLRDYFRLLRDLAIRAGDIYGLDRVDMVTFNDVLVDARNDLSRGLFPDDRAALSEIRRTHDLANKAQLALMNSSFVLEYNHTGVWWEANPLLWDVLK